MASKRRKGGIAPYLALVIALIIFVPALRNLAADLLAPLWDMIKNSFAG
ncbi:hypothetical protein [Actinosynnema sp. NPDC020468]